MSLCTAAADYSLVSLRIPQGDRPDMKAIDQKKAEGLKELVELMKKCWDENPSERPKLKGVYLDYTLQCCTQKNDLLQRME